ncbi:MAG: glutamate--tRNA ligase family protein, partial [Bacteroidales bacterium]|nr:glutamate--tRNA ligase family protein [Bacteroidales bacterium]
FPVCPRNGLSAEGETYRGYREDGYFPEAFVNLLAMLGWNPGTEQEMFSMKELTDAFSIDKVSKSGAKFNPEKARWFNKEYLRLKTDEELTGLFIPVLESHGIKVVNCPACAKAAGASVNEAGADLVNHVVTREYVRSIVSFTKERATFVKDFWTVASYLFVSPKDFEAYGIKAGASVEPQQADAKRQPDPRAKVFDDSLTAPFLAKDVDKFFKPEISELVVKVGEFISEYSGTWPGEAGGAAVEDPSVRTNGLWAR